tara:strand:+ start:697 stop:924 length:228 start_codon:yes stop_codon:yes gene_type:complete
MAEYIPVEDNKDLARDMNSRGIVNTNMAAYEAAVARSRSAQKNKDELRDAVRDINSIKSEMHEIKSLLMQMMDEK